MGTGEHVPFFTKMLHYYQTRRALAQARQEAKKAQKHNSAAHRALTEDDVGSECCDDRDSEDTQNNENDGQSDRPEE